MGFGQVCFEEPEVWVEKKRKKKACLGLIKVFLSECARRSYRRRVLIAFEEALRNNQVPKGVNKTLTLPVRRWAVSATVGEFERLREELEQQ